MELSFSTNAFIRHTVFEAVDAIGEIGYAGVELLADTPHLYAPAVTESDLDRLKTLLAQTGLQVANINANTAMGYYGKEFWEPLFEPSLANPDPSLRRWRVDYTKRCIDMAHALGSHNVSITSGRMVPGTLPEKSMGFLRESLEGLLDYAASKDVRLGMEYEPGLLIEHCEELAALIDDVGSSNLGANLDLGHSHVFGENLEAVVRHLSQRLFHIHIEDIRFRKHYHLIPGTGDMDFGHIFSVLNRFEYQGFVTVELYTYPHEPAEAARRSFEHLKSHAIRPEKETQ